MAIIMTLWISDGADGRYWDFKNHYKKIRLVLLQRDFKSRCSVPLSHDFQIDVEPDITIYLSTTRLSMQYHP